MPVVINIFILAMTVKEEDEENKVAKYIENYIDIDLDGFTDDTQEFIKSSIDNKYFRSPVDCKPFHGSDSIGDLINRVFEIVRKEKPDYDIQPYFMSVDVGGPTEEKYDFLMKEHIRIIDSLSLINRETKSLSELLEKNFEKYILVLCCSQTPNDLRVKLVEIRKTCFPFLSIYKKRNIFSRSVNLDINTEDAFTEKLGQNLIDLYLKMSGKGKPDQTRLHAVTASQNIPLERTSIS